MEDNKTYIVSMGDTRKYRVSGADLKKYEEELKSYISHEFAGEPINFYDSVTLAESDHEEEYPELTHVEFEKVKSDLKRQLEVRASTDALDLDAPYSDVDKSAI